MALALAAQNAVSSKPAGTTIAAPTGTSFDGSVPLLAIMNVTCDNPASTTAPTITFGAETGGGSWTLMSGPTGASVTSTAGSGIWMWTYYKYVPSGGGTIGSTDTFANVTFSTSVGAKALALQVFTGASTSPDSWNITTSTSGSTVFTPTVPSGSYLVAMGAAEGNSISGVSGAVWTTVTTSGTSGGNSLTNLQVGIQTGTGSGGAMQTSWTGTGDVIGAFSIISPAPAGTPVSSVGDSASLTITESSSVVVNNAVSTSDTSGITFTASTSISGTATTTDTAALTISESSSVVQNVAVSTSDTSSISIAGSSGIAPAVATSDTAAVTITESSSIVRTTDNSTIYDWGQVANASTKTAGTSIVVTNTSPYTIPAGALIMWAFACDNPASTTQPNTSITNNTSGASFNALLGPTRGSGVTTTAGSGIWTYTVFGTITSDVAPGGNFFTLNWNVSVGAKAVLANAYTGMTTGAGSVYANTSVANTAGTPSATTTASANVGDLVVGVGFGENTSITADSDTVGGNWSSQVTTATSGSTADTNLVIGLQSKIITVAGTQTYNPTTANDSVAHIGAIISVANSTVSKSTTDTAALTITDATAHNIDVTNLKTIITSREQKRINVGMLGASLMEGYPCTLDKTVEQFFAAKVRAAFPTSGSPTGLGYLGHDYAYSQGAWSYISGHGETVDIALGWGGKHTTWYTPATGGGYVYAMVPSGMGPYTSVDINFLAGPDGDPLGFKYSIDGAAYNYVNNYAAQLEERKVRVNGPINSYVLIVANTGTQNLIINAVTAYNGDESKGVQAHIFGHAGFTIQQWMGNTGGRPNWLDDIIAEDIDYLVVSDIGVNDGNANGNVANGAALTAAAFQTKLSDFIDYIRAGGYTKKILLVAAYDVSYAVTFVDPWSSYVSAIQAVATAKGTDFLDLTQLMPASPNAIYSPTDNTHSNDNGDAYRIMAEHFFTKTLATPVASAGDSASMTISESSSILNVINTSDTASVAISESTSVTGQYTPVIGTETPAVTITDTSSSLITLSRSDASAVTITETSSASGTAPGQETIVVSISDVSASLVTLSRADTSSVSIADVSTNSLTLSRTDTSAVTASDVSQPSITMSRADTAAVTISDASSNAQTTFVGTSDAASLTIADTSASAGTATVSDGWAITVSETASNGQNNGLSTTDTSSVSIAESRAITISISTADTSSIAISETSASSGTATTTDSAAITITDASASNQTIGKPGAEAIAVSIADISTSLITVSTGDTSSVSMADSSSPVITMTRPDTAAVTITESRALNPQLTRADTASVSIAESRTLTITTYVSTSDTSSISTTETNTLSGSSLGVDGFSVSIDDASSVALSASQSATDGAAMTITEGASVQIVSHNQPVVRMSGAWVRGVFKVYTNGVWTTYPVKVYGGGNWT